MVHGLVTHLPRCSRRCWMLRRPLPCRLICGFLFAACPAFVGVTLPGPLSSGDCFLPLDSLLGLAFVPTSVCLPRSEAAPSASACVTESLAGHMPACRISSCCSAADHTLPRACFSPLDADAVPACTPTSWWNAASEMWFVGRFAHA